MTRHWGDWLKDLGAWLGVGPTPEDEAPGLFKPAPTPGRAVIHLGADAPLPTPPTRGGATAHPDLTHSAEQKEPTMPEEPTPEQRRDAWLGLVKDLEVRLVMTRENAKACGFAGTYWAAQRLLDSLKTLEPPAIPVDNEKGQEDLLEYLEREGPRVQEAAEAARDERRPWDVFGRENATGDVKPIRGDLPPFYGDPGSW